MARGAQPRPVRATLAFALAASLALPACGGPNQLTGSLDAVAPLQFDAVTVRVDPHVLAVEFDRSAVSDVAVADGGQAAGADVAFKMAVNIDGLQLDQGLSVDLAAPLEDGRVRASCTRAVGTDPRRDLPPIKRGTLVLDANVNYDQVATGHFHILFDMGGDIGEGRTVNGRFRAVAQNADPGSST